MKRILFILCICISISEGNAQEKKLIKLLNSDVSKHDQEKYGDAILAVGNILAEHDGVTIQCEKAIYWKEKNELEAIGNVLIKQGDSITQTSGFASYNGNTRKAKSWENVILTNSTMQLESDTVYFDRNTQILSYRTGGKITDPDNILTSRKGRFYLNTNKFEAQSKVNIVNKDSTNLVGDNVHYFTNTGIVTIAGPTTITNPEYIIYGEKGKHNSKTKISILTKNASIDYGDRNLKSDSIYNDEKKQFTSATGNITLLDTINNSVLKGGYAEYYKLKDSTYITKRAVAISEVEDKDSLYIHGQRLVLTGKKNERILRAYRKVKFFKQDLRGKCDSLYSSEISGITKMNYDPVLWVEDQQITGDTIHMISNKKTEQLDSLKVMRNGFMISKDSLGYNQIKGRMIYGLFNKNNLDTLLVDGSSEVISYNREEGQKLEGITKMKSSKIFFTLKENDIQSINFLTNPEGTTLPLSDYTEDEIKEYLEAKHPSEKILKGFQWRIDEKPKTKEDIFPKDLLSKDVSTNSIAPEVSSNKELKKKTNPSKKRTPKKKRSKPKAAMPSLEKQKSLKHKTFPKTKPVLSNEK